FLDERCDAARIFLLRDMAARESANRPAACLRALPALVPFRALLGRLVFGDERNVGHRQRECGGVLVRDRLIEALDRLLDVVRRRRAGLDPRYLHEAVLESFRILRTRTAAEKIEKRHAV